MNKSGEEAFVLKPGNGRAIDLGSFNIVVKASGDETNGAFSLLEASEPAGFGPPLHIHRDAAEVFYVLEGEYIVVIEGRESSYPAGSFIFIPACLEHGFRVGGVASRKLNLYTPAAMVGYFDELPAATQAGHMDPDSLSRMALHYSMEVIGPVPEGYIYAACSGRRRVQAPAVPLSTNFPNPRWPTKAPSRMTALPRTKTDRTAPPTSRPS